MSGNVIIFEAICVAVCLCDTQVTFEAVSTLPGLDHDCLGRPPAVDRRAASSGCLTRSVLYTVQLGSL